MPGQPALKVTDALSLKDLGERYKVTYELRTGQTTITKRSIKVSAGSSVDVETDRPKAFVAAEKIRKTIPNALNIKVRKKDVGNEDGVFGQTVFNTLFLANEFDTSTFTVV